MYRRHISDAKMRRLTALLTSFASRGIRLDSKQNRASERLSFSSANRTRMIGLMQARSLASLPIRHRRKKPAHWSLVLVLEATRFRNTSESTMSETSESVRLPRRRAFKWWAAFKSERQPAEIKALARSTSLGISTRTARPIRILTMCFSMPFKVNACRTIPVQFHSMN